MSFAKMVRFLNDLDESNTETSITWERENGDHYKSIVSLSKLVDLNQSVNNILSIREIQYYNAFKSDIRKKSYINGRYAAKSSVHKFIKKSFTEITILNGVFNQPIIAQNNANLGVSISHSENVVAAIGFSEYHPLGIDIEEWKMDSSQSLLECNWTDKEKTLLQNNPKWMLIFWCAKEALSKVLKTGFTVPLELLEIDRFLSNDSHLELYFKNFKQYRAITFTGDLCVLALAVPCNSKMMYLLEEY